MEIADLSGDGVNGLIMVGLEWLNDWILVFRHGIACYSSPYTAAASIVHCRALWKRVPAQLPARVSRRVNGTALSDRGIIAVCMGWPPRALASWPSPSLSHSLLAAAITSWCLMATSFDGSPDSCQWDITIPPAGRLYNDFIGCMSHDGQHLQSM